RVAQLKLDCVLVHRLNAAELTLAVRVFQNQEVAGRLLGRLLGGRFLSRLLSSRLFCWLLHRLFRRLLSRFFRRRLLSRFFRRRLLRHVCGYVLGSILEGACGVAATGDGHEGQHRWEERRVGKEQKVRRVDESRWTRTAE